MICNYILSTYCMSDNMCWGEQAAPGPLGLASGLKWCNEKPGLLVIDFLRYGPRWVPVIPNCVLWASGSWRSSGSIPHHPPPPPPRPLLASHVPGLLIKIPRLEKREVGSNFWKWLRFSSCSWEACGGRRASNWECLGGSIGRFFPFLASLSLFLLSLFFERKRRGKAGGIREGVLSTSEEEDTLSKTVLLQPVCLLMASRHSHVSSFHFFT